MLAISVVVVQSVLAVMRIWHNSSERSDVQQQAMVGMYRLTAELKASVMESVVITEKRWERGSCCWMTFVSATGSGGRTELDAETGELVWQKHVAVYLDTSTLELKLQDMPLAPPLSNVPRPLQQVAFTPRAGDRVVARHIRSLSISARSADARQVVPPSLLPPVTIAIEAERRGRVASQETSVTPLYRL